MIAENIGSDLSRLTGELDKLILSIFGEKGADGPKNAKNGRITPQMVEEQIGVSKEFNGYELRDALINRNVYKANLIIKYILTKIQKQVVFTLFSRCSLITSKI